MKKSPIPNFNEIINKSTMNLSGEDNAIEKLSLYPVSIKENNEYYYGNIEILDKGLNIYNEDIEGGGGYYFQYEDSILTKLHGEASYKLKIEIDNKELIAIGVFFDFFEELKKYTQIKE